MPRQTHLVLIGGGHSHAIALKMWALQPLENVQLTLISDVTHTPYSGMLPGHVAGFYNFSETHINLCRLAENARANFCLDRAINLDLKTNQVICYSHLPISFDYLSIDIGSIPETDSTVGAKDYTIPAKPVPIFLQAWQEILQKASKEPNNPLSITIVGGGAGGVELAFNMQSHLTKILSSPDYLTLHLIHRGKKLLSTHSNWVSQHLETRLKQKGIRLHLSETVSEIQPAKILCESGLIIDSESIFWVTSASAPPWIWASGLGTDSQGFIRVGNTLQTFSHPHIFAVGDIASMDNYPRPKAGVFAVRQGKPLFENLQRIIQGNRLKPYIPQKKYLSLIGTGDRKAVADWGIFGGESALLWQWKDRIDRAFMEQFEE